MNSVPAQSQILCVIGKSIPIELILFCELENNPSSHVSASPVLEIAWFYLQSITWFTHSSASLGPLSWPRPSYLPLEQWTYLPNGLHISTHDPFTQFILHSEDRSVFKKQMNWTIVFSCLQSWNGFHCTEPKIQSSSLHGLIWPLQLQFFPSSPNLTPTPSFSLFLPPSLCVSASLGPYATTSTWRAFSLLLPSPLSWNSTSSMGFAYPFPYCCLSQ